MKAIKAVPGWLYVLCVGTVAVAAASWWSIVVVEYLGKDRTTVELSRLGTIGDIFGAVAALFAGLGFVAIAAALVSDVGERRKEREQTLRSRIPYLVPKVETGGAKVFKAYYEDTAFQLGVAMTVKVENIADEAAINVAGTCRVTGHDDIAPDCIIDSFPVPGGEDIGLAIRFSAAKDVAVKLQKDLVADRGVVCEVEVTYRSLNKKQWKSSVNYRLNAILQSADALSAIVKKEGEDIEVLPPGSRDAGKGALTLEAAPVPGTFECEPA